VAEVPDPLGGPPFALLRFALDRQQCFEAGRVIAGEVGPYDATWGSFLEAPSFGFVPLFRDGWAPSRRPASGCGQDPPADEIRAILHRYDDRVAVLEGIAGARVRALTLRGPDGDLLPVARSGSGFIAATPMTGALNEYAPLVLTLADGRRRTYRLFLGPHDAPQPWTSYTVRGTRVLRVHWTGPRAPFSGADVRFRGRTAVVTVFARHTSSFAEDNHGTYRDTSDAPNCADVVLPRPLAGRRVVGGWPARRVTVGTPPRQRWRKPPRCARVRAGERLDVEWDLWRPSY
jgi:hypothetical protein